TLFAPTNAAFAALDPGDLEAWTGDPGRLRALLAFHAVDPDLGVLAPTDFQPGTLRSIHGAPLTVDVAGSTVTVDGATIDAPLEASNGVVYRVDAVLVPPA